MDRKVSIIVNHSGNGILDSLKDKIFQTFFTTKPTGHITGPWLSLVYNILKANAGEFKVTSIKKEGIIFSLLLPV
jgi:C4-dicarboxylate-specific signal transduction histidine kinase